MRRLRTLLLTALALAVCPAATVPAASEGAEAQRKLAEEQWQELLAAKPATFHETDHFLLFGTVPPKELDACAKSAEKAIPLIKKSLRLDKDPVWKGKLVVFVFQERAEFASVERNVNKRNPDREDRGGYYHFPQWSLVTVGPAATSKTLPYDFEVAQFVASAALTKEYGTALPEWLVNGYGRSVVYRLAPKSFGEERQRAVQYLRNRSLRDVLGGSLTREEGPVLNASLADYLANGIMQNPTLLQSILIAYGLRENATMEQALAAVRLTPDAVDAGWHAWAAKVR